MDNEPNEREKEIANDPKRICLMESATGVREQIARALANYRAELRPEPTAGDREAAEALADELAEKAIGIYIKPYVNDFGKEVRSGWDKIIDIIADALSAARGNRAELEAAAREAVAEACEFCHYGKKELPGRHDYCKSEHCQWLKIINALAEKG